MPDSRSRTSTATLATLAHQLLRYGLVGVLSNVAGYGLYMGLLALGGTPKLTMTVLYAVGATLSFFSNRRFTFRHDGHIGRAGFRFMIAYALGYVLNFVILWVFVDQMGMRAQWVQAFAIVAVALFLFALSRSFVFSDTKDPSEPGLS